MLATQQYVGLIPVTNELLLQRLRQAPWRFSSL